MIDNQTILYILGSALSGGTLIGGLQWWSSRRGHEVAADNTVVEQAAKYVEMVSTQLAAQTEQINDLDAEIREMRTEYNHLIDGCLILVSQVVSLGHKPDWTPRGPTS